MLTPSIETSTILSFWISQTTRIGCVALGCDWFDHREFPGRHLADLQRLAAVLAEAVR
jgi:hypothetical protein